MLYRNADGSLLRNDTGGLANDADCCCDACVTCPEDYNVTGVVVDGTWATPGYADGCPPVLIPGSFILETSLRKSDTPGCERYDVYQGDRCDSLYYHALWYSPIGVPLAYWTKTRRTIYVREWSEVRISLKIKNIAGTDKIVLVVENWWIGILMAKNCTFTTVNQYSAFDLASAKTAELDYECLMPAAPTAYTEADPFSAADGWSVCGGFAVKRSILWEQVIDGDCSIVCGTDLGTPVITGERFIDAHTQIDVLNPLPTASGDCSQLIPVQINPIYFEDRTVLYEKMPDGSTPASGDYTHTFGSGINRVALTGSILGQKICSVPFNTNYSGVDYLAENYNFSEPIWPIAPTASLICE